MVSDQVIATVGDSSLATVNARGEVVARRKLRPDPAVLVKPMRSDGRVYLLEYAAPDITPAILHEMDATLRDVTPPIEVTAEISVIRGHAFVLADGSLVLFGTGANPDGTLGAKVARVSRSGKTELLRRFNPVGSGSVSVFVSGAVPIGAREFVTVRDSAGPGGAVVVMNWVLIQ